MSGSLAESTSASERRAERRIRVRLPVEVRGTDLAGTRFEERTTSENVCRGGLAFSLSRSIAVGADLDIHIPGYYASMLRVPHFPEGPQT
jgi:hypothetical protein